VAPEAMAPPDRGWRYHLRHQTPWSRGVLAAGIGVNLFFFIGIITVLSAHGWSRVCPEGVTRLQCSPSDPLAEGITSAGLGLVLQISLIASIVVMVVGFLSFRRMPTKPAREAAIVGAVISTQALVLSAALLWFRGTDVGLFARNFLNFSLIGQKAGIAWNALTANAGSIFGQAVVWAAVVGALVGVYAWLRKTGLRPVVIGAIVGGVGGALWGIVELAQTPSFIKGAQNTLVLSAGGAALGFGLGLVLALFSMSNRRVVRTPARIYINFFRGTPLIWQLSFAGIGLVPALRLHLSMYTIAILVLGLNLAAYSAGVPGRHPVARAGTDRGGPVGRPHLLPVDAVRGGPPGDPTGHPTAPQRVRDPHQGHLPRLHPGIDRGTEGVARHQPRHLLVIFRRHRVVRRRRRVPDHHHPDDPDRDHRRAQTAQRPDQRDRRVIT